jgi:hypothetical protein
MQPLISDGRSTLTRYEFKQLFGNIKAILEANEHFYADLERSQMADGPLWGQVAAEHVRAFPLPCLCSHEISSAISLHCMGLT